MQNSEIFVLCVYGDSNILHLNNVLIPSLARTTKNHVNLLTINFNHISKNKITSGVYNGVNVINIDNLNNMNLGFAAANNILFKYIPDSEHFVIINPDTIPQRGSVDALIDRKKMSKGKAAIIEGRQWPFEHPKEYDPLSLKTPWASGAFSLIDYKFFRDIGGMDEIYYLYLEDVDLSWQAWLNGYSVLYEPMATVTHFTGFRFYRYDLISAESYLSIRNFLIIARKFFGDAGESKAISFLKESPDIELVNMAKCEYMTTYRQNISSAYIGKKHQMVKILGLNRFHEFRAS
jgi:GT2 family glycosyltransferase